MRAAAGALDGMIALADQCLIRIRRKRLARHLARPDDVAYPARREPGGRVSMSPSGGRILDRVGDSPYVGRSRRALIVMSWIDQRPDDAMDGAFTVVGPEDRAHLSMPADFREAMSRLGAAVHVITTAGPGGKTGATATAVCSVSDAPPTLMVCLNRAQPDQPGGARRTACFASTLWAHGGAEIADIFAGRTGVRGAGSVRHRRVDGAHHRQPGADARPLLRLTAASSKCGRSPATMCSSAP